ncbi:MAG: hypothetical protein CVU88_00310 [Firmicutes bacterium HGW-Firmicutes-13]|nr:MAG: hypothetical protein CVU88_00310 [Firmicutes bacterium HGW-Firmicutes-13]
MNNMKERIKQQEQRNEFDEERCNNKYSAEKQESEIYVEKQESEFDRKDILAFIMALYRIIIPQLMLIGLIFCLVIYFLLRFWFIN